MLCSYHSLGNENIEIRYVEGERQSAMEAFETLEAALPVLTAYFELEDPLPKVSVVLVPDRDEFDRLVRDLLRIEIEIPSHPARIAQPQRTDMVVLTPSAYESHSIFKYVPGEFRRLLVHELVHMVEEHLSPNIEASPRWWSEGLAVYLSGQWIYDAEFRAPAFDGIAENRIPGFHQVEYERKQAYDWGWTIVRFIEITYGRSMILQVVKGCADGDVFAMLGVNPDHLETQWKNWLSAEGSLNR